MRQGSSNMPASQELTTAGAIHAKDPKPNAQSQPTSTLKHTSHARLPRSVAAPCKMRAPSRLHVPLLSELGVLEKHREKKIISVTYTHYGGGPGGPSPAREAAAARTQPGSDSDSCPIRRVTESRGVTGEIGALMPTAM